ncbi:hypothetical protein [Mycobacteroides abscessus]|uniref:hypothetical protein n=1 Tax=Mycobacteroides abscessus TaxID=36809 RepID=UPI0009264160|nr:hypothetical protein [Mycobacteroides abscessus]SIE27182.1 Uncharacterised protein [Mycobacteroides abscessus subsp. abscessus]SIE51082.1 Uncharacterised protein [Mycobacteroides abscessus subsp. abscessus]SLL09756.1 Uncharacterised protein [Mycobacteroides abscessus subsp. abscessus]
MRAQEALDPLEGGTDRRRHRRTAGKVVSDSQGAGSPWDTDVVTSWVSPNLKKNKKEE